MEKEPPSRLTSLAGTTKPFQCFRVDLVVRSHEIHDHGQLHRQLEQHPAHAVVALRCDGSHVGEKHIGKIVGFILRGKVADIEADSLFNELRLAGTVIPAIQLLDFVQRFRVQICGKLDFVLRHTHLANTPFFSA